MKGVILSEFRAQTVSKDNSLTPVVNYEYHLEINMNKFKFQKKSKNQNPKKFRFWLFNLTSKVISWLVQNFENEAQEQTRVPLKKMDSYIQKLDLVFQTRGQSGLLNYVKSTRTALLNYLSSSKSDAGSGIALTKDGIPRAFGDLIPEIRRSKLRGRYILPFLSTILWATRSLKLGKKPDFTPITSPAKLGCWNPKLKYVKLFWKKILGYRIGKPKSIVPKGFRWKNFRHTVKGGPNGQALVSAVKDYYSLSDNQKHDISTLGGKQLTLHMLRLELPEIRAEISSIYDTSCGETRRLTYFPDREDKVRVIAILDYYSQEALKPLHDFLFSVLRKIPQDCTFDQESFISKMKGCEIYYSIDLTAATDRFPIQVISSVLKGYFSDEYVSAWERTMVSYPFKVDNMNKKISYSVGNPMGAYSSWASFALANHFVVFQSCINTGVQYKTLRYCVLGDDIVIGHDKVAEEYIRLITALGVEISKAKTHVSKDFLEFAKRLAFKDGEVTPFPISALKESSKRYYLLVSLLLQEQRKGWVPVDGIPPAIENFYTHVKPIRRKLRRRLVQWAAATELVIKFARELIPATEVVNTLGRQNNDLWVDLTEDESKDLIFSVYQSQFYKAANDLIFNATPLGNDPAMKTDEIWDLCDRVSSTGRYGRLMPMNLIPLHNVMEAAKVKATRLSSRMMKLDPKTNSEWLQVKVITTPTLDKSFTMKSMDLRTLAAAKIGRTLIEKINNYSSTSVETEEPERELSPLEKLFKSQGIKLNSYALNRLDDWGDE